MSNMLIHWLVLISTVFVRNVVFIKTYLSTLEIVGIKTETVYMYHVFIALFLFIILMGIPSFHQKLQWRLECSYKK